MFIAIIVTSCDSECSTQEDFPGTHGWCITRIDSVTILCIPRYNDNTKPFIIKTNNNEIN